MSTGKTPLKEPTMQPTRNKCSILPIALLTIAVAVVGAGSSQALAGAACSAMDAGDAAAGGCALHAASAVSPAHGTVADTDDSRFAKRPEPISAPCHPNPTANMEM